MPALESHTGLLRQTIPFYNRRKFVNVSPKHTNYSVYPALRRNMMRAIDNGWTKFQFGLPIEVMGGGGTSFKFNIQVTSDNTLEGVSEDDPISIDKKDFQVQGDLPWRLFRVFKYSYGKWELSACRGQEELVNLLTTRRLGAEQGAADGLENWFWGAPPASTDTKTPFPLRYYIYTEPESSAAAYNSTTGFATHNETTLNGNLMNLNHNSYSGGPFGQSRATYRTLGNWNCQYTSFSDTDLIDKYIAACMETDWHSPVNHPDLVTDAPNCAVYTTRANLRTKARLARQQNDANGSDLAARISDNEFFRIPWYAVPVFNDSSAFDLYGSSNKDVVYGLDWSTIHWASKTGFTMEEEVFPPDRNAPLSYTHAAWLGGQLICIDPRRNFVLSK